MLTLKRESMSKQFVPLYIKELEKEEKTQAKARRMQEIIRMRV